MYALNETHDPRLTSWVVSANARHGDFPIQNLPFCVFRRRDSDEPFRCGVAIGDQVLDLRLLRDANVHAGIAVEALDACAGSALNPLMALDREHWSALRSALSKTLRSESPHRNAVANVLVPQAVVEYSLPATIGDYTDFYTSIHHAIAVGRLFRPDNPLLPNYKWVPIGYHGRASSVGVSQDIPRPVGQLMPNGATSPVLAPSARVDFELEVGIFIGGSNALGERVTIERAEDRVFGLCVLDDWSARDIQGWEYQPLGPFLSKSFATTISPWIVTLEALAPYRLPWSRPADDPQPLPYLESAQLRATGLVDIQLEVQLQSARMRAEALPPHRLTRSNFRHSYWSMSQLVTHHTVNGCNLRPGDLLGSGTLSGPDADEAGSMLELTAAGTRPITLPTGETRKFIEDGDSIIMRAWCEKPGSARVGFGEAVGRVLPPRLD